VAAAGILQQLEKAINSFLHMKPLIDFDKQPFLLLPATKYNAASFPFINASTFFHSHQGSRALRSVHLQAERDLSPHSECLVDGINTDGVCHSPTVI